MLKKGQQEDKQLKTSSTQKEIELGQWLFRLRDAHFSSLLSFAEISEFNF